MGQPKALLCYQGQSFVDHLSAILLAGGCTTVTVVIGAHAAEIRAAGVSSSRLVEAVDWAQGMRASLRAGLLELPPGSVLLTHVDRPRLLVSTVQALLACLLSSPGRPLIAGFKGQPGHPIIIPATLRPRLEQTDDVPLRDLLQNGLMVGVDDPGVLENINTPAAYNALISTA